jgi:hypothetical protein
MFAPSGHLRSDGRNIFLSGCDRVQTGVAAQPGWQSAAKMLLMPMCSGNWRRLIAGPEIFRVGSASSPFAQKKEIKLRPR